MQFEKIEYENLTAREKEQYNFQKVAAILADYGFNCIKLSDDWQGADFLAYRKDEDRTLKVQLKARLSIYQKYEGKDIWMCFPVSKASARQWYLICHDKLVEIVGERTSWLNTPSWKSGAYSSANPSKQLLKCLEDFKIGVESEPYIRTSEEIDS